MFDDGKRLPKERGLNKLRKKFNLSEEVDLLIWASYLIFIPNCHKLTVCYWLQANVHVATQGVSLWQRYNWVMVGFATRNAGVIAAGHLVVAVLPRACLGIFWQQGDCAVHRVWLQFPLGIIPVNYHIVTY